MTEVILSTVDILNLIPHRYPMLLVDKIINIDIGNSCVGIKNVTINEPFFSGHFPKEPIMPGVLIIEAIAQTAACLVCYSHQGVNKDISVYFLTIQEAKFRKPVLPGDSLHMFVETIQNHGKIWKIKGIAKVAGQVHAEVIFTAMVTNKKVTNEK